MYVRKFVYVRPVIDSVPIRTDHEILRFIQIRDERGPWPARHGRGLPRIRTYHGSGVVIAKNNVVFRNAVVGFSAEIYDITAIVPQPSGTSLIAFAFVYFYGIRPRPVHESGFHPVRRGYFRVFFGNARHQALRVRFRPRRCRRFRRRTSGGVYDRSRFVPAPHLVIVRPDGTSIYVIC